MKTSSHKQFHFSKRATPVGIELVIGAENQKILLKHYFGAFFQYPGKHGAIMIVRSCRTKQKSRALKQ